MGRGIKNAQENPIKFNKMTGSRSRRVLAAVKQPPSAPRITLFPGDLPGGPLQRQVHVDLLVLGGSAQGDLDRTRQTRR